MTGNVWEWCSDWYGENYYANSPQNNPRGPGSGTYRVNRGGSRGNTDRSCQSSYRGSDDPDPGYDDQDLGFRFAIYDVMVNK